MELPKAATNCGKFFLKVNMAEEKKAAKKGTKKNHERTNRDRLEFTFVDQTKPDLFVF